MKSDTYINKKRTSEKTGPEFVYVVSIAFMNKGRPMFTRWYQLTTMEFGFNTEVNSMVNPKMIEG